MKITKEMADIFLFGVLMDRVYIDFDACIDEWVGKDKHISDIGDDCRPLFFRFMARMSVFDVSESLETLRQMIKSYSQYEEDKETAEFLKSMLPKVEMIYTATSARSEELGNWIVEQAD